MVSHLKLLRIYLNNISVIELENKEIDPFYRPYLIDECHFCGACAILCPGCGTCTHVCYYKALEMGVKKADNFKKNKKTKFISKT